MTATKQTYVADFPIGDLHEHPRNPRAGSDEAVERSIDGNGWYGAIVAQAGTNTILAGHTRRRALLKQGATTAPVIFVECDDETATKILLADNRTAELALWDEEGLSALLKKIADESPDAELAIIATGFDPAELQAIADAAAKPPAQTDQRTSSERYDSTNIREIRLTMIRETYEPFMERLEKLRAEWELDNFAQVVRRLIDERRA
jgi:ParB-like chromosome segregation protein Spo0J